MTKINTEVGITNLGDIPKGMSFLEATKSVKNKRKYFIDPYVGGHRLTICDTLRMMWRETDNLPDSKEKLAIRDYIEQSFDYGKRMDARMKHLKYILEKNDINY